MKNITANDITKLTQSGKVIIVFHGIGCLNCKIMQPIIDNLELAFPHIKFYRVNIDLHPHLLQTYKINSLPTLLPFHHGKMLPAIIGVKTLRTIKRIIDQTLNYA